MTLIEVAVAVAVLSMMGMLAYGGLSISLRSQTEMGQLQERYHTARITLERIKRELSMAFVSLHQAEDKRTVTFFEGEEDHIAFVTSAHEPFRKNAHESDQIEVEYRLDVVDGQRVIVRRMKLHIDDSPGKGGREEVVAVGVKELEFAYYDKERESWEKDWEVEIDDAAEKRAQLKLVRQLAEDIQGEADAAADNGNPLAATAAELISEKLADEQQLETLDNLFLPPRVRIRIVLEPTDEDDNNREYLLETQVEIPMVEPLWY